MSINFTYGRSINRLLIALLITVTAQLPARAYSIALNTAQHTHIDLYKNIWINQLAPGQTLHYSWAFLNRRPRSSTANDTEPPLEQFRIQIILLRNDGTVIAQREASAVSAGQIEIFDFDGDELQVPSEPRTQAVQVRLQVTVSGTPGSSITRVGVPASEAAQNTFVDAAEIIDKATGRTTVSLGAGLNGALLNNFPGNEDQNPTRQEFSAGNDGLFGIVPGQSLLASALNIPELESSEEAVDIQVKAYDKDGNLIGESGEVELLPNHSCSIQIRYEDLRMPSEPGTERKQARLRMFAIIDRTRAFAGTQPILSSLVFASFQIVDSDTGKTVIVGKYLTLRPRPADVP